MNGASQSFDEADSFRDIFRLYDVSVELQGRIVEIGMYITEKGKKRRNKGSVVLLVEIDERCIIMDSARGKLGEPLHKIILQSLPFICGLRKTSTDTKPPRFQLCRKEIFYVLELSRGYMYKFTRNCDHYLSSTAC